MAINVDEATKQLDAALANFEEQAKKLRTGRANAAMLDGVKVEVYGQDMPLAHMSSIAVVDASLLQITPFDPNNLDAISLAIRDDEALGLNPADDGRVVRVPIPAMTTERRQEVVKALHEKAEQSKISFRNARHDLFNSLKKELGDKDISEDVKNQSEKQFTEALEDHQKKLDELVKTKEQEIMTV